MRDLHVYHADASMQVRNLIRAGFGVEDIHVKTGLHIDAIRFVVRQMRASGELARLFKEGTKG